MLRPDADPDAMAAAVEEAVVRFRTAGLDVLIGLGVDSRDSPIIELTRNRTAIYNINLVGIAAGTVRTSSTSGTCAPCATGACGTRTGIHLNASATQRVAQAALVALGLEPDDPAGTTPLPASRR